MNKDKMIKLLGAFFIVAGSIQLISSANDTWWSLASLFHSRSSMKVQNFLFYSAEYLFLFLILPLAILSAGIGMIRIRRWGWLLAVTVCVITFITKFASTIYFAYAVYKYRDLPMPTISSNAYVAVVSMWPTYISTTISVFLIFLLTRHFIKKEFNK